MSFRLKRSGMEKSFCIHKYVIRKKDLSTPPTESGSVEMTLITTPGLRYFGVYFHHAKI